MSNLKHLITLACFLMGANFAFGQTLTIMPDMGSYTPESTQDFTFTLANITDIRCQGTWAISAESSSNYGDFTPETIMGEITLMTGLNTGSTILSFATPPSGDLTIMNITATPPAGCPYSVLTDEAVTLTAAVTPAGICDMAFLEDFSGVNNNTGLEDPTDNGVVVGQGTAYQDGDNPPNLAGSNTYFKVVTDAGNRRFEARNIGGGEVYWESNDITVGSCCSRDIEVGIFGENGQPTDYVGVYYKVNGGSEVLIDEFTGTFTETVSLNTNAIALTGAMAPYTLNIVVRVSNSGTNMNTKFHGLSSVSVGEGSVIEAPQILNVTCTPDVLTTTLTIDATAEVEAEFSIDEGVIWQDLNTFMGVDFSTMPTIMVRDAIFTDCGTSEIIIDIDELGNCNFVLPIALLDFYGRAEADAIGLYWSTTTEVDNDYMAVERSLNGVDFEEIGRVDGKGTTTEKQDYTFVDNYPVSGTNYYRLRQVDYDGAVEYHPVISVLFDRPLEFGVKVSPNPAQETLWVDWSLPGKQDGVLRVYDMQGQLMSQRAIAQGSGRYNLPIRDLPAGMYVLQMEQGGKVETLRFVKK